MRIPWRRLAWVLVAAIPLAVIAGLIWGATRDLRRRLVYVVNPTHRGSTQLPPIVQRIVGAAFGTDPGRYAGADPGVPETGV